MKNTKKKVKLQLSLKPFQAGREFRIALVEQLLAYCFESVYRPNSKDGILTYTYYLLHPADFNRELQDELLRYADNDYGPYNYWDMVYGNGFRDMCYIINRRFTGEHPDVDITKYPMLAHIYEPVP